MKVIRNDMIVEFDIDDTLIRWKTLDITHTVPLAPKVKFVEFEIDGFKNKKAIIEENIEELKLQKMSGAFVRVHTKSGFRYAEAVIKALGLEDYVDECCCKPDKVFDDKDPSEWMPKVRHLALYKVR